MAAQPGVGPRIGPSVGPSVGPRVDSGVDFGAGPHIGPRIDIAERLYELLTAGSAWLVLLLLLGIGAALAVGGSLAFQTFGWGFVVSREWDVGGGRFGALVPIYGTLVSSAIAMLIAVPVGLGIAFFLTDVAPRFLRGPLAVAVELLAAIPSIIYGMWGLFVLAPFLANHIEPWLDSHLGPWPVVGALFRGPPIGIGLLTAGIVLGIMVTPFISAVARDLFATVPPALKESAVALGATRWEVLRRVVLPHTRSAVTGAVFLGLGRALGETMAVTFVIGNAHALTASLLRPGNSIAATLANEFAEADGALHQSALVALALLLFAITFVVLALARLLLRRMNRPTERMS